MSNEQGKIRGQPDAFNDAEKNFIDFIVAANSGVAVINSIEQLSLLWNFYTFKGKCPENGFLAQEDVKIFDLTALKKASLWRNVTAADLKAAAEIPPPKFLTDELIAAALYACCEAEGLTAPITIRDKTTGEEFTF